MELKVRSRETGLGGFSGLSKIRRLAHVVGVQFLLEGVVIGLGEHALFLQNGQDTHGLKLHVYKSYISKTWYVLKVWSLLIKKLRILILPNLFNEINASLQIHSKVDEFPLNTFLFIFFLFQDEHVMVKELLKPFVGVVDTQLFEAVEL